VVQSESPEPSLAGRGGLHCQAAETSTVSPRSNTGDDFDAANVVSTVPRSQGDNQMKKLSKTSPLKLTLDRETLRRLSSAELHQAVGGGVTGRSNVYVDQCPSAGCGPVLE
jgi:hypothetical protein